MGWRLFLRLLVSATTALTIFAWPERPVYVISNEDREFLAADVTSRHLIFLFFDQDGNQPPVVERRDVATGHVISTTPLEWADIAAKSRRLANRNGQKFGAQFQISADGTSLLWSQMAWCDKDDGGDESCGAVFDVKTGRHGTIFDMASWDNVAWSPDGRWMLLGKPRYSHALSIIDTRSGKPIVEFDAPSGDSTSVHGCFSPDNRRALFQWSGGPNVYQVDLDSLLIERKYRLAEFTTNEDNDNVWESLAEWRPGELRTHLTYCAAGTTQFFQGSFRKKTCRRPFDGVTLSAGELDPFMDDSGVGIERGTRGEGDGWVARAIIGDDTESKFSQWLGGVENWWGRGLLMNWRGRYGTRFTVQIIDRATNAVRYEFTEFAWETAHAVLDGTYLLLGSGDHFEVWRTNAWPRWCWAIGGGIGVFAAMCLVARFRAKRVRPGVHTMPV
jgi:hypothetical protein